MPPTYRIEPYPLNDIADSVSGAPSAGATILHSPGRLERLLRAGEFVVTAETTPPVSTDPEAVLARARCLEGVADAVNVTDGAGARAHLSSLTTAGILARAGIEPVLQFTVRDRNRLALQGDLLGAAASGVPNILCLRGDDASNGDQPETKMVHDLESRELMALARRLRDDGRLPSGRAIDRPPELLIGGADAPVDPGPDWRPDSLRAKIAAGADFFQTQFCFDIDMVRRYMARLRDEGVLEGRYFLIGIGPIASAKSARWMNANLFGVEVPDATLRRLDGADDQRREGLRICVELIDQLKDVPGVSGAHLMGPGIEQAAAEAIAESGILGERGAS